MPKLLIAEDHFDLRNFLQDELTDAGFTTKAVDNGADAIVSAVEETFDLVLPDMLMPGMNGVKTIRVLRKILPNLPIVGLTGYIGRGYMAEAATYGGATCLSKPVKISDLIAEINEAMNNNP